MGTADQGHDQSPSSGNLEPRHELVSGGKEIKIWELEGSRQKRWGREEEEGGQGGEGGGGGEEGEGKRTKKRSRAPMASAAPGSPGLASW